MKFEIIQRILQSSSVNNYLEADSIKRVERLLEDYQALIKQYKNCALGVVLNHRLQFMKLSFA